MNALATSRQKLADAVSLWHDGTGDTVEVLKLADKLLTELDAAAANDTAKRVTRAIGTLSLTEQIAASAILESMDSPTAILVCSKIADAQGVSRSNIVSLFHKLESAGLLETRSLGTKGTMVRFESELAMHLLLKYLYLPNQMKAGGASGL